MGVEGVDVLGSLEPVDDEIGERRREDLVGDLQQIALLYDLNKFARGEGPGERDHDDQRGIDRLADHC